MRGFGELEAAIMDRIWSARRPLLVREVQQPLRPERACNTVRTVTEILCWKGWLTVRRTAAHRHRARAGTGTVARPERRGWRWPPDSR